MLNGHNPARAADALHYLPPDCDRGAWVKTGMAFHAAGGDFDTFDQWSAGADSYNAQAARATWRSFKAAPGGVSAGALFGMARDAGWQEHSDRLAPRPKQATTRPSEAPRKPAPGMGASEVWERLQPATNQHGYVKPKGIADDLLPLLREVPPGDLICTRQPVAGFLAVPAYSVDGVLQSIQFVPPNGGKKLNLVGASMSGGFLQTGPDNGPVVFVESLGNASAVYRATGGRAIACFGSGNIKRVVEAFRQREPGTVATIAPDRGKEGEAFEIAEQFNCRVACLPESEANNFDLNDLLQRDGFDVLAALLESASEPPAPPLPLSVAFADELSDTFTPPDELVQGLLPAGDGSIMYGDSNTGKTFVIVDLACSVARGVPWMDRQTEPGLVVYLAAESPASVRSRLQAYQRHHGCKVPNFAIVQNPIDLFDGDTDTDKVILTIKRIEAERGQKARLIVGDTLARLSAGANENAGQDMGLVVRRFDRIRTETGAHFCLIHHSGKNQANGARGWSGVRAAVDTEIELTDSAQGKCIEVTKQRDLPGKGDRIGFRLEVVTLGHTKWGFPATSCVVVASDAPIKATKAIKLGETQQAVMALLRGAGKNLRIKEIAEQLAEQDISKTSVYNAVNRLRDVELLEVSGGMVHLIGGKP